MPCSAERTVEASAEGMLAVAHWMIPSRATFPPVIFESLVAMAIQEPVGTWSVDAPPPLKQWAAVPRPSRGGVRQIAGSQDAWGSFLEEAQYSFDS